MSSNPFGVSQEHNGLNFAESVKDPNSRIARAVRLIKAAPGSTMTKRQLLLAMYQSTNVADDFIKLAVKAGILMNDRSRGLNELMLGPESAKVAQ